MPVQSTSDPDFIKRFWSNVVKTDTCWLWTGGQNGHGYGRIWMNGRALGAHRIALEWKLGRSLRNGMESLHTCDIRNCVRNDDRGHLFEGTQADNGEDMASKGRAPNQKLTPESIAYAWERIVDGATQRVVAKEIGVAQSTLRNALIGKTWKRLLLL